MILVSACLAGESVRYDGRHCLQESIAKLVAQGKAMMVCPEVMGGLPTPREPAEIVGGTGEDVLDGRAKVIDRSGQDVTAMYVEGAYLALEQARKWNATRIVLKENSPSCGSTAIYDGSFSGKKVPGLGVTAALLKREGFTVVSEEALATDLDADICE